MSQLETALRACAYFTRLNRNSLMPPMGGVRLPSVPRRRFMAAAQVRGPDVDQRGLRRNLGDPSSERGTRVVAQQRR